MRCNPTASEIVSTLDVWGGDGNETSPVISQKLIAGRFTHASTGHLVKKIQVG